MAATRSGLSDDPFPIATVLGLGRGVIRAQGRGQGRRNDTA